MPGGGAAAGGARYERRRGARSNCRSRAPTALVARVHALAGAAVERERERREQQQWARDRDGDSGATQRGGGRGSDAALSPARPKQDAERYGVVLESATLSPSYSADGSTPKSDLKAAHVHGRAGAVGSEARTAATERDPPSVGCVVNPDSIEDSSGADEDEREPATDADHDSSDTSEESSGEDDDSEDEDWTVALENAERKGRRTQGRGRENVTSRAARSLLVSSSGDDDDDDDFVTDDRHPRRPGREGAKAARGVNTTNDRRPRRGQNMAAAAKGGEHAPKSRPRQTPPCHVDADKKSLQQPQQPRARLQVPQVQQPEEKRRPQPQPQPPGASNKKGRPSLSLRPTEGCPHPPASSRQQQLGRSAKLCAAPADPYDFDFPIPPQDDLTDHGTTMPPNGPTSVRRSEEGKRSTPQDARGTRKKDGAPAEQQSNEARLARPTTKTTSTKDRVATKGAGEVPLLLDKGLVKRLPKPQQRRTTEQAECLILVELRSNDLDLYGTTGVIGKFGEEAVPSLDLAGTKFQPVAAGSRAGVPTLAILGDDGQIVHLANGDASGDMCVIAANPVDRPAGPHIAVDDIQYADSDCYTDSQAEAKRYKRIPVKRKAVLKKAVRRTQRKVAPAGGAAKRRKK